MTVIPVPKMMQPLRDEHVELLPHIRNLRTAADAIGEESLPALRQHLEEAYAFLTQHLLPHAQAEDAALYPVAARIMGAPDATATMSRDHVAVGELVEELGRLRHKLDRNGLTPWLARALRRVLYGLYTLVSVHFAKEEELYLPLMDAHLTPVDADEMFRAMEAAAQKVRERLAA